jgi:ABC-type antimicrobial peptide transport system permease subunit
MRRALYVGTVFGWVFAVVFAVLDVTLAFPCARVVLIVSVAVAATLSNVTLFAVIVAPLERVYRHGYEAGQHAQLQSCGYGFECSLCKGC